MGNTIIRCNFCNTTYRTTKYERDVVKACPRCRKRFWIITIVDRQTAQQYPSL